MKTGAIIPYSRMTILFAPGLFALGLFALGLLAPPAVASAENTSAPERVAPGVVSLEDRHEFGSVISRDGATLYIGVEHGSWASIVEFERIDGGWRELGTVIGDPAFSANDPFLSPDESRLYFITPVDDQYEIGFLERSEKRGWSAPVLEGKPINSPSNEYYISFTASGDLVFASDRNASERGDFDIYLARHDDGRFAEISTFPIGINSSAYEADAFISPDEEYIVFSSNRSGGRGRGDLYISFSLKNGEWTHPLAFDPTINTEGHELCPFVTHDKRWLYFTSDGDIFRVGTAVIERLRQHSLESTKMERP